MTELETLLLGALKLIDSLENTELNEWDAVEQVIPKMCAIAREAIAAAEAAQPDELQRAVEAEREECAKVCEEAISRISEAAVIGKYRRDAGINTFTNLAAAIRARGNKH